MKPISLRFSAFGAYVQEQCIDFTTLADAGLFLIHGETGSGKTIILDAITFALYGKSSGGGRGDMITMRSQIAPIDNKTFVELVFSAHGKIYKFVRSLKTVKKHAGGFEHKLEQTALVQNDVGIFEPLFENPKIKDVEQKVEELVGLNYDQFRQVIILPQGQFEKLLVAGSEDKEKILVSLFGVDKWQKAAEYVANKINEQRRKLDVEKENHRRIFAENDCEDYDGLKNLCNLKKEELILKTAEQRELAKRLNTEKEAFSTGIELYNKFNQKQKSENELASLRGREKEIYELNEKLNLSEKAEAIKPVYEKATAAENNKKVRQTAVNNQKSKTENCLVLLNAAQESVNNLTSLEIIFSDKRGRLVKLAQMTESYQKLDEAKKLADDKTKTYCNLEKSVASLAAKQRLLAIDKKSTEERQAVLYGEYSALYKKFTIGVSGILAKELVVGAPCPVCGSTDHPAPAKLSENDITEEMIELKKVDIEAITELLKSKTDLLNIATNEHIEESAKLTKAIAEKESTAAIYNSLLSSIDKDIADLKALNANISLLEKEIARHEENIKQVATALENVKDEYTTAYTTLSLYEKEAESAVEVAQITANEFETRLKENGFADIPSFKQVLITQTERKGIQQIIKDFNLSKEVLQKSLDTLLKELAEKTIPDIEKMKAALSETEALHLKLSNENAVANNVLKKLDELVIKLDKELTAFEIADKKCSENQIFAKHIRGDNGISLQRYVLGVMLSSITNEANRLLENVHGGRYRLHRTVETTGRTRKAGLELEVFDNTSGENRSVTSLSGGEKFLVSLTLAIGLSTVVQAQAGGIRIDAMFIDEGFGTLDSASITDALMILTHIRHANGLVGIISHVQSMKESIPAQIEVVKDRHGSNLFVRA